MKYLNIKPGSIIVYKKYNLLKCWWSKLMRKELPFNKYSIYFGASSMFVETTNIKVKDEYRYVILEPIKPYSKKEEKALELEVVEHVMMNNDSKDVFSVINIIRPCTIDAESFTINGLLKNKYYRIVYDSKGKNF